VAASAAENGEAVTLPVKVLAAASAVSAPSIDISVGRSAATRVEVPVANVTSGTVAVIVEPDGSEHIVRTSTVTDGGVELKVSGNATVKIIDNTKNFYDAPAWAADSIAFVSSRELFNGTSANTFTPNASTTRAQLMTVLARLDGADASTTSQGIAWAVQKGISNGSNPSGSISRQQLAVMLYRYAGAPAVNGSLDKFPDAGSVAGYADAAMRWAVANGIISGTSDGRLDPTGTATRAHVAAMVARYVAVIA
jgi:hypothetical protein